MPACMVPGASRKAAGPNPRLFFCRASTTLVPPLFQQVPQGNVQSGAEALEGSYRGGHALPLDAG